MKFTISSRIFSAALERVCRVVSSKPTLPILSSVLLRVDNAIELFSTNFDQAICLSISARIESKGEVAVPARRLCAIVQEMPDGDLSVCTDDKRQIVLRIQGSVYRIAGANPEEYPAKPRETSEVKISLETQMLSEVLKKVAPAMSGDTERFALHAVLLRFSKDKLEAVATDGRRLSYSSRSDLSIPLERTLSCIVPSKSVSMILEMLNLFKQLTLRIGERTLGLDLSAAIYKNGVEQIVLQSKLVEGKYPDFERVLTSDENGATLVRIPVETFVRAVARAAILNSGGTVGVRLAFAPESLVISAQTKDVGEAREEIPEIKSSREVTAAFNPQFLQDALSHVGVPEVKIFLRNESLPAVIVADGFKAVVMPIRVNA